MNDFVIPLPDYLKKFESDISNFGLCFQKFFPYVNNRLETVESLGQLCGRQSRVGTSDVSKLLKTKRLSDIFRGCNLSLVRKQ